jgi:8-oxo-dGTP pyrophosphatase MutT (NUDIX family)
LSRLRLALLRPLYRVAWRLLQLRSTVLPHRGRGVKCLLTHRGQVLMVRHTYGARRTWYLPGGGARRRESPEHAAAREMEEELGLRELPLRDLITRDMRLERIAVRLTCLHAEVSDPKLVRPDPLEIAEVAWFSPEELPRPRGSEVDFLLMLLAAGEEQ